MFGIRQGEGAKTQRIREIRQWVRETHGVPEEVTVMVTELACPEPGCPPVETVVAVLHGPGNTVQGKIARPMAEVTREDVSALVLTPTPERQGGQKR